MKIFAKDIVGPNAISMQSGQLLYEKIYKPLLSGEKVEIDFADVELFASPFFNASIGYVIKDIDVNTLKERLEIKNLSEIGRQLLNQVIANAISYYDKITKAEEDFNIIIKNADDN